MQRNTYRRKAWAVVKNIAVLIGLGMLIYNGLHGIFGSTGVSIVHAQTDQFLSRRVDVLEQRLYSIESRIDRISVASRPSMVPTLPSTTPGDIDLLRTTVEGMRLRLGEVECGVLRLDERTLPAAQRRTGRTGSTSDRCRDNYGTSITLSARP
jgi:hypothetical protein